MNNNIIYALQDPITDEYRYVGKSIQGIKRAQSHFHNSHNPLVREWVDELNFINETPKIHILEEVNDWTQLPDKEKYWVGKLLEDGYDLFNIVIRESYSKAVSAYTKQLKEQLNYREKNLQIKLNNSLMKFGTFSDAGKLLKARRKELHIKQPDLAEIANVSLNTIYKFERYGSNLTMDTFNKLLDCVGYEILVVLK